MVQIAGSAGSKGSHASRNAPGAYNLPGAPGNHGLPPVHGYLGHNPLEQKGQCAEEECDPEKCGDEFRAPGKDSRICGVDQRPLLPLLLFTSTVLAGVCMLTVQLPLYSKEVCSTTVLFLFFGCLYAVTLGCMIYCALCDPGTLRRDVQCVSSRDDEDLESVGSFTALQPKALPLKTCQASLPKRAHKTWLYSKPIRRYDHYCRWVMNCIGLLNHREFVVMCTGLVTIGIVGAMVDTVLFCVCMAKMYRWATVVMLVAHLAYSITTIVLAAPILRIHVGLISRNELAAEWKNNDFYVLRRARNGETNKHVNDLDDEEFNDRFDSFAYDDTLNHFDEGASRNCWNFWCVPRWPKDQLGDF